MGPKEQIKIISAAVSAGHLQNAAVLQPFPFLCQRNEGNSQLSTQLYPFQSSPDTWEILLQPKRTTNYNCLAFSCGIQGSWAGSLLPNSTSHLAPLQWKWKHLHWKGTIAGMSAMVWAAAARGTAQACTAMLCCCARAPSQFYSQGVNTQLWRRGRAPEQARTCPGLSTHPAAAWMCPLHCQNSAKTPGNPWLLILVLPERNETAHGFCSFLFCEVRKFSNIFTKW